MLGPLLPELQKLLSNDGQRATVGPIQLDMENDSYYAVHSSIETGMSGPELTDAYHCAFPTTGERWLSVKGCIKATSLLLQQEEWPYCTEQPKCRRPNVYNRADLTINYVESLSNLPRQCIGQKLFSLPLVILEVEGSKDKTGKADQQAKAVKEVLVSLAVMPECYLVFIYPSRIEIWKAQRNPEKCCIDITAETIHTSQPNIRQAFETFLDRMLQIIVRQAVSTLPLTEHCIAALRNNRHVLATGHTRNSWAGQCCEGCYELDTIRSAAGLKASFPKIYLDWEGLPPSPRPKDDDDDEDMA